MWGYYGPGWDEILWMGLGSLFWLILPGLAIWLLIRSQSDKSRSFSMPVFAMI